MMNNVQMAAKILIECAKAKQSLTVDQLKIIVHVLGLTSGEAKQIIKMLDQEIAMIDQELGKT